MAYDKKCRELFGDNCTTNFTIEKFNEMLASIGGVIKSNGERKYESKTSKYRGVSYHKPSNSWQSRFYNDGKDIHLGYFPTTEEAAMAYDKKAFSLLGPRARLNFPDKNKCKSPEEEAGGGALGEINATKDDLILFKIASGLVNEFEDSSKTSSSSKKVSRKKINDAAKGLTLNKIIYGGSGGNAETDIPVATMTQNNVERNNNNDDDDDDDDNDNNINQRAALSMYSQPFNLLQGMAERNKRSRYPEFLPNEGQIGYDQFGYNSNMYQYTADIMGSFMNNINPNPQQSNAPQAQAAAALAAANMHRNKRFAAAAPAAKLVPNLQSEVENKK